MHPGKESGTLFRVLPQCGGVHPDTVVISVKPAQDDTDPSAIIRFNITLINQTSELVIERLEGKSSLVVLSPALMRLGRTEDDQCRALLNSRTHCRLRKGALSWCPIHREYYQLLHNEQLMGRRICHEKQMRTSIYNCIQTSLAARIMINEILYAGDNSNGDQVALFNKTKQNRDIISQQLLSNKSDGSGRMSISSIMDGLLDQMKERENSPESHDVWQDALVVNILDVYAITQTPQVGGRLSSVFQFGEAACPSKMRDRLFEEAERHGNLPDLSQLSSPPPGVPKPLTKEEQKAYWDEDSS
ncbi:uncharacterized protein B0H64DRAFT_346293 [Chaetomium fimeti]|uniref:Uncharacterized protein n=1 Tax=Chaetomium fimeti TaxID=1854472 RepID=A0AAE0LQZ2_9PEZI|nr:hypothetical protein B0H64DRAFT_346293 [Chaetomium fimeti]